MLNHEYFGINPVIYEGKYHRISSEVFHPTIKFSSEIFRLCYYDTSEEIIVLNNDIDDYETESYTYPDKHYILTFYDLKLNNDFVSLFFALKIKHSDLTNLRLAMEKYSNWLNIADMNMISFRKHISDFDINAEAFFLDHRKNSYKTSISMSFFIESIYSNNKLSYYFLTSLNHIDSAPIKGNSAPLDNLSLDIEGIYLSKTEVEELIKKIEPNKLKILESRIENENDLLGLFK